MMAPHWLDGVFASASPEDTLESHPRFREALVKAESAYKTALEHHKKNPRMIGSSPGQQARVAFLELLNAS